MCIYVFMIYVYVYIYTHVFIDVLLENCPLFGEICFGFWCFGTLRVTGFWGFRVGGVGLQVLRLWVLAGLDWGFVFLI